MLTAILIRLAVFGATALHPIVADNGRLISPRIVGSGDVVFYQMWENWMFRGGASDPNQRMPKGMMVAGPVFPSLIYLFKYENGNSWPLAILYLLGGVGLCVAWLYWLYRQGFSTIGLIIFALLPHAIYYMIRVTTELPFSIFLTGFIFCYFNDRWTRTQLYTWIVMLLLLLATRPNGLSVLGFVTCDLLFRSRNGMGWKLALALLACIAAGLVFGRYFYTYFMTAYAVALPTTFFGVTTSNYIHGIFPVLPTWLNHGVSLLVLIIAKLLYLLGLRPSYSNVWGGYVLLRALPGVLFLIGLVYALAKGEFRYRLFLTFFILPFLLVTSEDRYAVPIQPLLFLFFAKAISGFLPLALRLTVHRRLASKTDDLPDVDDAFSST